MQPQPDMRRQALTAVFECLNRNGFMQVSPFHQALNDVQEAEAVNLFIADVFEARQKFVQVFGGAAEPKSSREQFSSIQRIKSYNDALGGLQTSLNSARQALDDKENVTQIDELIIVTKFDNLLHVLKAPVLETLDRPVFVSSV